MVDKASLEKYLAYKFVTDTSSYVPILGLGEVNQVYEVTTADTKYILRANDVSEYSSFVKERWCYEQAVRLGIPVPQVISIDQTDSHSFFLMEYIAGDNCSVFQKDTVFRNRIFSTLGNYVAKLATLTPTTDVGDLKSAENAKKWFYMDYLDYELSQTQRADDYLVLDARKRDFILQSLGLLKNTSFDFALCHGDISLKNCIYNKDQDLIYLIDFGCGETHVKSFFEIAVKWLEVHYDKSLSQKDFETFVSSVIGADTGSWLDKNLKLTQSLAVLYVLDKYRFAHDRSPDLEEEYSRRLFTVLDVLA